MAVTSPQRKLVLVDTIQACWEEQHKKYLERLQSLSHVNENESTELLVQQVLHHYKDYYDYKSKAAETDVFIMFSPPWFTSYERTLLWFTGFKPSLTFLLINKSQLSGELNQQQQGRIQVLREETRRREREIAQAMASVQESVAAPTFCGLVKREGSLVDGEASAMENAVEELKAAMREVMRNADDLRLQTGLRVLEVLTPPQKLKLLAAMSHFWLQSRRLGQCMDQETLPFTYC